MEAAPAMPFVGIESEFLFEFPIVALDSPALMRHIDPFVEHAGVWEQRKDKIWFVPSRQRTVWYADSERACASALTLKGCRFAVRRGCTAGRPRPRFCPMPRSPAAPRPPSVGLASETRCRRLPRSCPPPGLSLIHLRTRRSIWSSEYPSLATKMILRLMPRARRQWIHAGYNGLDTLALHRQLHPRHNPVALQT